MVGVKQNYPCSNLEEMQPVPFVTVGKTTEIDGSGKVCSNSPKMVSLRVLVS